MRVLYDGKIYDYQVAGGINRYFANLIGRLPESYFPFLLTRRAHEVNYPAHPNLKIFRYKRPQLEKISYRLDRCYDRLEKKFFEYAPSFNRFDVAHPTYYSLLTRREVGEYRCPVVLTVWDMINELFPEETDPTGQGAEEKRRAIMAAQAIICISAHTKKDLLERYALPEGKVTVTHLASEIDETISHGPEPVPARPYYLYVGSRASYKNFDTLLKAFAEIVVARPDVELCVVGAPFSEPEEEAIAQLTLTPHVAHYGYAGDRHLAKLYRCSIAFVYPSLYEGFGLPPLEAMSCGTAVIASDSSSIPEVVGDAGLLFDPRSTSDLAEMMLHLYDDQGARVRLVARGRERVKAFSWEQTVAQTLEVYRAVSC